MKKLKFFSLALLLCCALVGKEAKSFKTIQITNKTPKNILVNQTGGHSPLSYPNRFYSLKTGWQTIQPGLKYPVSFLNSDKQIFLKMDGRDFVIELKPNVWAYQLYSSESGGLKIQPFYKGYQPGPSFVVK